MIRIFKLVVLLVISQVAFGQAPSNYTNINGRYRWIAGMFDSTFHIPKGSTPSLRTGGSTNSGGLFYNTSDSSVYTYTGTQWIKLRGSINPSDTTNKYVTQVYKKSGSDSIFYVKGGTHTWAFNDSTGSPGGGGGGKIYYFNGGVSMGTISGLQMYELGDTANTGTAANFTRSTTGNIANFITDPGKPGLLQIPAGVWSVDAWLSETGGGANHAEIWIEVEKWDGSTITTIATSPIEQITEGATPNLYSWSVSIPTTSLTVTDRIIIQFYISNTNGKTVTLYTQNGYVGEVHTTFTTGIGAINGLTAPAQYLVTGTSGTDFNISSATATHTFNLPTASATNRGALSTTDWSTFNNKIGGSLVSGYLTKATGTNTIDTSQIYQSSGNIGIGTTSIASGYKVDMVGSLRVGNGSSYNNITINGNSGAGSYIRFQKNGTNKGDIGPYSAVLGGVPPYSGSNDDLTYSSVGGHFFNTNAGIKMYLTNAGNLGLSASPDSMLTVLEGAYFQRGVRMSGLPTGVGTKAVRINANGTLSVADTLANGISGTGTTNYIPKFTSSSAIGNSQIFDNGTSVGIGTTATNANEKLRVDGGRLVVLGGSDVYQLKLAYNNATAGFWLGSPSANALAFYNDAGTERMRLDASGNLGLGTSAPSVPLEVNGAIRTTRSGVASQYLQLEGGDAVGQFITAVGAAKVLTIRNNSTTSSQITFDQAVASKYAFKQAGGESMVLDASGNLGLGTSSPSYKFQAYSSGDVVIAATDASNAGISALNLGNTTNLADGGIRYDNSTDALIFRANNSERMRLDASGNLGLGVTPSAWQSLKAIQINGGNSFVGGANQAEIWTNSYFDGGFKYYGTGLATRFASIDGQFRWFQAASGTAGNSVPFTQAMTLNASGNLGLGTSAPANILDIYNTNGFQNRIRITGTTNTSQLQFSNTGGDFYLGIDNSTASGFGVGGYSRVLYSSNAYPMVFFTNALERMRLDANGRLGIGISSPSAFSILDANGQIRVSNLSVQGFYQARTSDVAGSGVFGGSSFVLRNGATSEDLNFDIFNRSTSAWYTAMIIKNSTGNVGIGTSSPYAILDLGASGVANNMILRNTTSAFNLGYIGNAGGRVDIGFSNSNSSLVALPYLSVTSGGSVGIGTTSPNSILQIKGAFNIERSNTTDYSIIDNEGNLNIKAATGGGGGSFNTVFFTGGSERMRITSGGYLLLGTTTSAYGQAGRGTFEMNGTTDNILVQKVNNTLANYIFSDATKTEFYSTNFLQLSVNGSERMRITSSGELLINTTSDAGDYKLQVNGNSYLASSTYTSGAILYLRDAIATGSNTSFAGLLLGSSPGTDYVIGKQSTNAVGTLAIKTGAGSTLLTLDASGNQELTGSIKTAAPSGGTAVPWKLGNKLSTAVTLDTGNYIPVEVNGVTYYLALVTLN